MERKDDIIHDLITDYGQRINRLVYTFVKDQAIVEDLTQEIFIKCYRSLDSFSHKSSYGTWLYRIAVNHCKDYVIGQFLKKDRLVTVMKQMLNQDQNSPEDILLKKCVRQDLLKAVLSLSQKYREVIFLYYIEDLDVHEIMEILQIPKSTFYTRLRRGTEKLKQIYEGEGFTYEKGRMEECNRSIG